MADVMFLAQEQMNEAAARRAALAQSIGLAAASLQNAQQQRNRLTQLAQENQYRERAYKDALAQQQIENEFRNRQASESERYHSGLLDIQKQNLDLYKQQEAAGVKQDNTDRLNIAQSLAKQARSTLDDFNTKKKSFDDLQLENQRLTETTARLGGKGIIEIDQATKLSKLRSGVDSSYAPVVSKLNAAVLENVNKLKQAETDLKPVAKGLADLQKTAARYQFELNPETGDVFDPLTKQAITPADSKASVNKILEALKKAFTKDPSQRSQSPGIGLGAAVGPAAPNLPPSRGQAMAQAFNQQVQGVPSVPLPRTINKPYAGWNIPGPVWAAISKRASDEENAQPTPSPQGYSLRLEALLDKAFQERLITPPPQQEPVVVDPYRGNAIAW